MGRDRSKKDINLNKIGIRQKVEIYDGNETIEINKIILAL